ncbi:hypothetical protein KKI24_00905 [bacterium]|nr:hypothetical protein [bacterium]
MKYRFFCCTLGFILLLTFSCKAPEPAESKKAIAPQKIEKSFHLGGAPIEVVIGLSSESIELTDFLTVTVRIEHSETVRVEPPYLSESIYAPLLLVQTPSEELTWSEKRNRIIKTWTYRFEPQRSGEFQFHPLRFFFRLESEKQPRLEQWPVYEIKTSDIPYRVTSVGLDAQADIRDVRGPILPAFDYLPLILSTLGLGLLVAALWLGIAIRTRFRKTTPPAAQPVDYLQESLHRLKELEQKDYISQQQYERLHVELSAILRTFVEHRYGLRAREQTTDEFIHGIRDAIHFNTEQQAILQQFLELADLVKFATYDPGSLASREAINTVRDFILSTRKTNED